MNIQKASEVFHDLINNIGFSLEYNKDLEGYLMYDTELGKYRGYEEENEIDVAKTAFDVVEHLETFIVDCLGNDLAHEMSDYGVVNSTIDVPYSLEGILNLVSEWKDEPVGTRKNEFYKNHAEDIERIDLIINHIDKVNLELVCSMGYGDIKKGVAEEISNFYDEFTDEPEKPSVNDILKEMNETGVFETMSNYIFDIKDWQENFRNELSDKEIEASDDVINYLTANIKAYGMYHIVDEVKEIDEGTSLYVDRRWITPAVYADKSGIFFYGDDATDNNLYRRIDGAELKTESLSELYDFAKFTPTMEQVHEFATTKADIGEAIFLYQANGCLTSENFLEICKITGEKDMESRLETIDDEYFNYSPKEKEAIKNLTVADYAYSNFEFFKEQYAVKTTNKQFEEYFDVKIKDLKNIYDLSTEQRPAKNKPVERD